MKPTDWIEAHYGELREAVFEASRLACTGPPSREEFQRHLDTNTQGAALFESSLGDQVLLAALDAEHERAVSAEKALDDKLNVIRDQLRGKPLA